MTDTASSPLEESARVQPLTLSNLQALVLRFYEDVIEHPALGPLFREAIGEHWDEHVDRMVDFWSTVMLGSKRFRGNLVHKHMQLEGVTPDHFAAWIQIWHQNTREGFDPKTTYKLRRVAHDIGRQLFEGYFEKSPPFDDGAKREAHLKEHFAARLRGEGP